MNIIIFLILLTTLLVSTFVIIPKYAPQKDQASIKNWLGMGFNGFLLLWALVSSKGADPSLAIPFTFYLLVLGVCLSGVFWWIPKYINSAEQTQATSVMFSVVTLSIIFSQQTSPSMAITRR